MEIPKLLAMWRDERDTALADALDLVSSAARPEPITGTLAEQIEAWHALVVDPKTRRRALDAFPVGKIDDGTKQLAALAELDDPRVGTRILTMLEDPPLRSPASLEFWQRALSAVEELRDARAIGWLEHHKKRIEDELAPPMGRLVKREIERTLVRAKKAAGTATAAPEHLELLAALRKRHAGDQRQEDLLAAIYAAPDDDGPRLVLADHWLEAGDPRGEFVALQIAAERGVMTREQKKRDKELATQFGVEWLGPLAPVINKTGLKYRRGFIDGCVFKANNAPQVEKLIGHEAWSTVRILEMDSHWPFQEEVDRLISHDVFRSLRELRGYTSPALFKELTMSNKPRALTALSFNQLSLPGAGGSWSIDSGYAPVQPGGPTVPQEYLSALTDCPGLPMLRHLELDGFHRVDAKFMQWLFDGALGRRLERLTTRIHTELFPTYIRELKDHTLAALVAHAQERKSLYTLTRTETGHMDELSVKFKSTNRERWDGTQLPGPFASFFTMLEALPPDALTRLSLTWPKKKAPTSEQLDGLAKLLEARPGLHAKYPTP